MPRKRQYEQLQGTYYTWILRKRNGVYFGDGRSNRPDLGRHSLGTRDRQEAVEALRELDLTMAVAHGLADKRLLTVVGPAGISLEQGRELYEAHVARPLVLGGGRPKTKQRYKAVLDKFVLFAQRQGIVSWAQVTTGVLHRYAAFLDAE